MNFADLLIEVFLTPKEIARCHDWAAAIRRAKEGFGVNTNWVNPKHDKKHDALFKGAELAFNRIRTDAVIDWTIRKGKGGDVDAICTDGSTWQVKAITNAQHGRFHVQLGQNWQNPTWQLGVLFLAKPDFRFELRGWLTVDEWNANRYLLDDEHLYQPMYVVDNYYLHSPLTLPGLKLTEPFPPYVWPSISVYRFCAACNKLFRAYFLDEVPLEWRRCLIVPHCADCAAIETLPGHFVTQRA